MDRFSEKSLLSLGDYYVYGLIDPRSKQIFYIGKGTKNRVFEHEKESLGSPDSEKLKLKTIADIKNTGLEVEKIIINSNLIEEEAFAAEASLINAFNYVSNAALTNIVAGHHSAEALSVDEYERINGAAPLEEKDIGYKILVIKINRLYQKGMDERYEQGFPLDENETFYIGKSIAGLKLNQSAQNPITYLYPLEKDKIHI